MTNLTTKFLGIELKNPLVIGASNLVTDLRNLREAEAEGASAIIYKSLFEEQIQLEEFLLEDRMNANNDRHAEMSRLFPEMLHAGAEEYLLNLKKAVETVSIPVFASLNAVKFENWLDYAEKIENTGVAGIELNFYHIPEDFDIDGGDIEDTQLEIIRAVKNKLKIPVGVKISPFYSNTLHFIKRIDASGADGITIFNRLFQPDIDIENEKHITPFNLSNRGDYNLSLRYAGLLNGRINPDISAGTGILSGSDVIRMILAGADTTQLVSTLYLNKISIIGKILSEINEWMEKKGYSSLADFKGKLSGKNIRDPFVYHRAQYVDALMRSEIMTREYQLI